MSNISWKKTKENVETVIEKYLYACLSVDNCSTSEINKDFMLSKINIDDDFFVKRYMNISNEELSERIDFVNYFRMSFNKLTTSERKIIYWTYFDKEHCYDDRFIANELGYSLGYYYIQKKCTLIRFAFALGVEEE